MNDASMVAAGLLPGQINRSIYCLNSAGGDTDVFTGLSRDQIFKLLICRGIF